MVISFKDGQGILVIYFFRPEGYMTWLTYPC